MVNQQSSAVREPAVHPLIWQAESTVAGPFVFTSAVLATVGSTGITPAATPRPSFLVSDITLQTESVLSSISDTLAAAGSSLAHVVKANVFLADPTDFYEFDRVWNTYFTRPPTRTTVAVSGLLVPEAKIEISVVALRADSGITAVPATSDAPRPMTKKVEAVTAGDFVFTSGQLAHDAVNGLPTEATGATTRCDVGKQTAYVLANMRRSLAAAGATADQVVKAQTLLTDLSDPAGFDAIWNSSHTGLPALATIGISALLVTDTIIEIDLTAYLGDTVRRSERDTSRGPDAVGCGDLAFSAGVYAGMDTGDVPPQLLPHHAYPYYSSAVELQTEWVLDRLDDALTSVGSSLGRTVKAQVFLKNMADFPIFEQVWRRRFAQPPARSVVQVPRLPAEGAVVAVEVIAAARETSSI
ncbi:RidA family protein [Streptomyces sp. Root369]|uniref:RidA family protein n=1 Tax=Streptomyces sp. Root369 TaxID=1736523 RepID=UPI00070CA7EF|nr:RidA family protein [Streptomyces sp. Root369]KQV93512.1 hypothetical protein ASD08_15830 [Streptomyces sp. Root369]